jgi:hypothetical protein
MSEITGKIDKYAEKFLNLLGEILEQELKLRRSREITCKRENRDAHSFNPHSMRSSKNNYCENKHLKILQKLNINEEDMSLSDLEDEILKSCQRGGSYSTQTSHSTPHQLKERKFSRNQSSISSSEIFSIKKEPKTVNSFNSQIIKEMGQSSSKISKTSTDEMDVDSDNQSNFRVDELTQENLKSHLHVLENKNEENEIISNCSNSKEINTNSNTSTIELNLNLKSIEELQEQKKLLEQNDISIYNQKNVEVISTSSVISLDNSKSPCGYFPSTLQGFEKFTESIQDSKIHQPLRNITYTNGYDTWHDSRKSSENFMEMDVEEESEDLHFRVSEEKVEFYEENNINYSNNNIYNNCNFSTPYQTTPYANSHNLPTLKRNLQPCHTGTFKVPKTYKVDPSQEACSNLNFYNKPFIPKAKAKEKLKNIVPFLRDFKPRFLKKENIDKKILRKFRNYVKIVHKTDHEALDTFDKNFWKNFVNHNLLPPMKYEDESIKVEFKSFNTKYLLWLFSKEGSVKLYTEFSIKFSEQILQDFISAYDLMNNTTEQGIIEKLKYYISAIPEIYSKRGNLMDTVGWTDTYTSLCTPSNYSYISPEERLASYLGLENNFQVGQTFSLKFYEGPRRCGVEFNEDFRNEHRDHYDTYPHFVDSVMNASYESVPSS